MYAHAAGQLRVRVKDVLYSVELRHQENPGESLDLEDDEVRVKQGSSGARDWLCVWSGEEHVCLNVSRQQWNQGRGEVYTRISHSFHFLNVTGEHVACVIYIFQKYLSFKQLSQPLVFKYRCTCQ